MISKNLNLMPLGDRLVIEPDKKDGKIKFGIFLPETAKENPQRGTVLAAGPGRTDKDGKRNKMDVKTGDVVLFFNYADSRITIDRRKLFIINESDILAIVEM